MTNIARHAGASRVELALTRERAGVLLHIADDGRGLGGSAEGAGIRGLRERAILTGANLSLDTRPGGSTMVRLSSPWERSGRDRKKSPDPAGRPIMHWYAEGCA